MQTSQVNVGLVLRNRRRNSCAAGSGCEINSFARRIKKRCDTSATARRFNSGFENGFPLRTADATQLEQRLTETPYNLKPTASVGRLCQRPQK